MYHSSLFPNLKDSKNEIDEVNKVVKQVPNGTNGAEKSVVCSPGIVNTKVNEEVILPVRYCMQTEDMPIDKILFAFNYWYELPQDLMDKLYTPCALLWNSMILFDDICDESEIRNKAPSAHKVYGCPRTLNAAIYSYGIAMREFLALGKPEIANIVTRVLTGVHEGMGVEIYWRENLKCPTEEEYKANVLLRNSSICVCFSEIMGLFSENKLDCTKLMEDFGVYMQILNDYSVFRNKDYMDTKVFGEDITEGKSFGFPIMHAIQSNPDDDRILNILRKHTQDVELKKHCIKLIKDCGSFDYTLQVLENAKAQMDEELENLGGNPYLEILFDSLHAQLANN